MLQKYKTGLIRKELIPEIRGYNSKLKIFQKLFKY